MNITINKIHDDTPKGLTTGFRLRFDCALEDGQLFSFNAAVLVSRDVITKHVPLPNIVIDALKKHGLEDFQGELFVDSRRVDLNAVNGPEPELPYAMTLGGEPLLNLSTLQKLMQK